MKILAGEAHGIITARGGSKSIPLKNLLVVGGRPMVEYVARASLGASLVRRTWCSTDHHGIADTVARLGVEVAWRPEHLGGDDVNSIDVLVEFAESLLAREGAIPEMLVLLQPTSLFTTSAQVDATVRALRARPDAKSAQTVVKVPHQFHAHNQRQTSADGTDIGFVFEAERARGYNKQTKPVFYAYGNLITTRTEVLLRERTIFARPSVPIEIPLMTAYDLDGPDDIAMAELMLREGLVTPAT